jgi:hypothetical protein
MSIVPAEATRRKACSPVHCIAWPGAGEFLLTAEQHRVVRVLADATRDIYRPSIPEPDLLRQAKIRKRTIADVFAGSDALGKLVVTGVPPGWYRIAPPCQPGANSKETLDLFAHFVRSLTQARAAGRALLALDALPEAPDRDMREDLLPAVWQLARAIECMEGDASMAASRLLRA